MISGTNGSKVSAEDVLSETQAKAETMGLQVRSIEVTEEQAELIRRKTGYAPALVVKIGMAMPDMREVKENSSRSIQRKSILQARLRVIAKMIFAVFISIDRAGTNDEIPVL